LFSTSIIMFASSTGYERLPTDSTSRPSSPRKTTPLEEADDERDVVDSATAEKRARAVAELRELERALAADPRFAREAPAAWKRAALLFFMIVMFWLAVRMRLTQVPSEANPAYADRCVKSMFTELELIRF
jgi:hypothetical protein